VMWLSEEGGGYSLQLPKGKARCVNNSVLSLNLVLCFHIVLESSGIVEVGDWRGECMSDRLLIGEEFGQGGSPAGASDEVVWFLDVVSWRSFLA
jgi:hypothetical protein